MRLLVGRKLRDTDELVSLVPPVGGLTTLGWLVGEHREGAGEGSADGAGHGHPVSSSDVTVAEDEGVRPAADVGHLFGSPASGIGEQTQREQDSSEHLDRAAELQE